MDIFTKIFLINLILFISTILADVGILDEAISDAFTDFTESWTVVTLVSVPVWAIYFIVIH